MVKLIIDVRYNVGGYALSNGNKHAPNDIKFGCHFLIILPRKAIKPMGYCGLNDKKMKTLLRRECNKMTFIMKREDIVVAFNLLKINVSWGNKKPK